MKQAFLIATATTLAIVLVIVGAIWYVIRDLPDVREMKGCITAKMHQIELCPLNASYVSLEQISPEAIQAILVSEDISFFKHKGFEVDELKESVAKNIRTMSFARGGSTISQQLVKNVFLDSEKTILRKLREAILTHYVERIFTKDIILEKYLNVVQFGQDIFGIRQASLHYFKKAPIELKLEEGAYLAYLLPNPVGYSKTFEKKELTNFAQERIETIVSNLFRFDKITVEQRDAALSGAKNLWPGGNLPSGEGVLEFLPSF